MLRNRNIAFFIDVDNMDLTTENFDNIIAQLQGMGEILTGKIYGAKERKHKAIFDQAELKGYKVERPMRMKRRGRRDFDSRILVDVVDTVFRAPSVNAVCVITASSDLVYLYSYLHGKGIKVISSDENEEASNALVDEYVDLGRIYDIPLPVKPAPAKKTSKTLTRPAVATATRSVRAATRAQAEPKVTEEAQKADNTDELLKEIERLRRVAEEQKAEKEAKSKAAEEARAKAEAEARARAEEREKAQKAIEEARAKAREEAETKAREEERLKAQKAIEEAKVKAREEAEAKAREEERLKAQKEIEEARAKAREAAEKARQEEAARAKAEEEIRLKLAELAKTGGNNDELMRELEKLKSLTSETNQLVKKMNDEPKEKEVVVVRDTSREDEEVRAREDARQKAQKVIEEAQAKARAEAMAREEAENKAKAREDEAARARAEEREKAQKAIEEAKAKAREEAEAKAREEERLKAQKEIDHWRSIAEAAEAQPDENDSPSARYYIPRTDGKLIRKIEEMNSSSADDDNELLATIQNLLDGLDD